MFLAMKHRRAIDPLEGIPTSVIAYCTGVLLCVMAVLLCLLGWDFQKLFPAIEDWHFFWWIVALLSILFAGAGIGVILFTRHIGRLKRSNYHCLGK